MVSENLLSTPILLHSTAQSGFLLFEFFARRSPASLPAARPSTPAWSPDSTCFVVVRSFVLGPTVLSGARSSALGGGVEVTPSSGAGPASAALLHVRPAAAVQRRPAEAVVPDILRRLRLPLLPRRPLLPTPLAQCARALHRRTAAATAQMGVRTGPTDQDTSGDNPHTDQTRGRKYSSPAALRAIVSSLSPPSHGALLLLLPM